jgi:hypothetical protein
VTYFPKVAPSGITLAVAPYAPSAPRTHCTDHQRRPVRCRAIQRSPIADLSSVSQFRRRELARRPLKWPAASEPISWMPMQSFPSIPPRYRFQKYTCFVEVLESSTTRTSIRRDAWRGWLPRVRLNHFPDGKIRKHEIDLRSSCDQSKRVSSTRGRNRKRARSFEHSEAVLRTVIDDQYAHRRTGLRTPFGQTSPSQEVLLGRKLTPINASTMLAR